MDLTEDDVREILDLFERSEFDFFQLEVGDLKLTVSKGGYVPVRSEYATGSTRATRKTEDKAPAPAVEKIAVPEGLVAIKASMVGTFFAAPEPGAAPFVDIGAPVADDTTVGLIELMKVYTSVPAGVSGVISEVVVGNAQAIIEGQVLFLVDPDGVSPRTRPGDEGRG
jgi:acetyl-CoA carboxylase biotin carboxyl carrier protein